MTDAWMPGIKYVRATGDGGALKGGAPRAVWLTLDSDSQTESAQSAAQRLDKSGRPSHLAWNPLSGEIVQLIPIVRAARALGGAGPGAPPGPAAGPVPEVNNEGRLCVQICVVARTCEPFTAGPMAGLPQILAWLDAWGVHRRWPAGHPAPFPECYATTRSRRLWARGGHFGESQVPGLTAAGPGAIDIERLTGWGAPRDGVPWPRAGESGPPPGRPLSGVYDTPALGKFARTASPASLAHAG